MEILIAEDDPVNRMVQKKMLERLGATVSTAETGTDAVMAAKQKRFDLILLDRGLPQLDGIETVRQIRKNEGTSLRVPVIALTGGADDPEFYKAGMDGYLGKPVTMEDLKAVMKKFSPPTA